MTPNEYQEESMRTMPERYPVFENIGEHQRQILHAHLGLSSEVGEIGDAIKKYLIYGRDFDEVNIKEECGDLLWYIALILRYTGWTMEEAMQANINKLKIRYPEKFTEEHAAKRLDKQ